MAMSINKRRVANRKEALKRSRNWPQINDITLDVSVAVLTTLKGVAKICAVPFLSNAASIALSIFDVVQKMRGNKHGFKELATDSCQIVHEVIKAQQAVSQLGGIAVDLEENIRQLVNVLRVIMAFAQKGASRNFFSAMIRYNHDARRIQEHQRKLYQAIQIFGLQSDITLRKTVAQLADNQVAMANQLNNIAARVLAPPLCMSSSSTNVPNDIPRLMNCPMWPHAETIPRMDDNDVISTDITGGQDNEYIRSSALFCRYWSLTDGTCQVRRAMSLCFLHLKDDGGSLHLTLSYSTTVPSDFIRFLQAAARHFVGWTQDAISKNYRTHLQNRTDAVITSLCESWPSGTFNKYLR